MVSNIQPVAGERRKGTQSALVKFVQHRSNMLSLYWKVAGLTPFEDTGVNHPRFEENLESVVDNDIVIDNVNERQSDDKASDSKLNQFCEELVDYIAAGHFTLYDRITSGKERRQRTRELAEELYPRIASLTEVVIEFSDKYDACNRQGANIAQDVLTKDLSNLGEALAIRIELEDKLIESLQ